MFYGVSYWDSDTMVGQKRVEDIIFSVEDMVVGSLPLCVPNALLSGQRFE